MDCEYKIQVKGETTRWLVCVSHDTYIAQWWFQEHAEAERDFRLKHQLSCVFPMTF